MMEAASGVMWPLAKECREPLEVRRGWKQNVPSSLQGENGIAHTLISDFWPPELGENRFLLFQATGL